MASPPPEPAGAAGLEGLEALVLDTIIAKAGARPAAALACASTRLRAAVSEDTLWRRFCADDLGLDAPLDPEDRPLPSFKNDGGVKVKFIETQFVSSDAASFKSVVQRLTGKSVPTPSPAAPVPLHRPRARAPCRAAASGWAGQAGHAGSNNLMMAAAKREAHHAIPSAPPSHLDELHELCDFANLLYATGRARRDDVTDSFPY